MEVESGVKRRLSCRKDLLDIPETSASKRAPGSANLRSTTELLPKFHRENKLEVEYL